MQYDLVTLQYAFRNKNQVDVKLTSRRLWARPWNYTVRLAEADLGRNDFGEKTKDVSTFVTPMPETNKKAEK